MSASLYKVPLPLREAARWLTWRFEPKGDRAGKKPPCDAQGVMLASWNDPGHFLSFSEADEVASSSDTVDGVGFVLGEGFGGLDLDECRDPETGAVDSKALQLIEALPGAYAEVSPSGNGIKVFGRVPEGAPAFLEINFKTGAMTPKANGYFTVTGNTFNGSGSELPILSYSGLSEVLGVRVPESQVAPPLARVVQPGGQDVAMIREAGRLRRLGYEPPEIEATLWALVQNGRFPTEPGREPWTRADCRQKAESVGKYEAPTLETNGKGVVIPSIENLRRIVEGFGVSLRYDAFSGRKYLTRDGHTGGVTDAAVNALRFEIEARHRVFYPKDRFFDAVDVFAREHTTHPVREYLDGLKWDGKPRLDRWLVTYGGATDSPYVRAVGSLPLLAAVRRVRQPGAKFDELLVLESPQGYGKSTALSTLCPRPSLFSDSLPLGSDAKQVIEGTCGTWIAEASELQGMGARETDRLKNFLSRGTDGPVRLAYGRESEYVPRQFIVIGTTNKETYLHDTTGGRRFWPVRVGRFNVVKLAVDRDQIWAEASEREASGESIRLNRELWATAAVEQEERLAGDPWLDTLTVSFGDRIGFVAARVVWDALGVPIERRAQEHNVRLGTCMRHLGFRPVRKRVDGRRECGYARGLDLEPDGGGDACQEG